MKDQEGYAIAVTLINVFSVPTGWAFRWFRRSTTWRSNIELLVRSDSSQS
jgi:hypothetical protein